MTATVDPLVAGWEARPADPDGAVDKVAAVLVPFMPPMAPQPRRAMATEAAVAALQAMKAPADDTQAAAIDRAFIALAWHDVTCPEADECRDRPMHAASSTIATSGGFLDAFLSRIAALSGGVR